jgi:transposase
MQVELRYDLRRVDCPPCGVRVEWVPWAEHDSKFTGPFEAQVAYLAQRMDKTDITGLMGIHDTRSAASQSASLRA